MPYRDELRPRLVANLTPIPDAMKSTSLFSREKWLRPAWLGTAITAPRDSVASDL